MTTMMMMMMTLMMMMIQMMMKVMTRHTMQAVVTQRPEDQQTDGLTCPTRQQRPEVGEGRGDVAQWLVHQNSNRKTLSSIPWRGHKNTAYTRLVIK